MSNTDNSVSNKINVASNSNGKTKIKIYSLQPNSELQAFKTVLFHCVVIIVMPVVSFFTSKIFIFDGKRVVIIYC